MLKLQNITTLPEVLTRDQVHRLIAYTTTERIFVCFWTVYSMGLRLNEALHLQVGDVDAARGLVHIHRGKSRFGRSEMARVAVSGLGVLVGQRLRATTRVTDRTAALRRVWRSDAGGRGDVRTGKASNGSDAGLLRQRIDRDELEPRPRKSTRLREAKDEGLRCCGSARLPSRQTSHDREPIGSIGRRQIVKSLRVSSATAANGVTQQTPTTARRSKNH